MGGTTAPSNAQRPHDDWADAAARGADMNKSWRDTLPIYPAAEMFPLWSPEEMRVNSADIAANGLRVPVTLFREQEHAAPQMLDGRNRLDALEAVGFEINVYRPYP